MLRQNNIEDAANHYWLKGALYRRKTMSPKKLYGVAYFGIAGSMYSMFPTLALSFG